MAKRSFKRFVEQELGRFPLFLIYAVLEWMLIIVLFIDGFLAFFANEFARFFELKIPCLLCTRIDHFLVHRHADFYYNDSVCETHKKDVSSLAYCHVHKKLSDIRKMCEGCLLSFATEKESDCDTYKSLVGILHQDIELFVGDDHEVHLSLPARRKDDALQAEKISLHCCSCCGGPLKVKSHSRGKNVGIFSQAPAPSPRAPFVSLRNEEPRNMDLPHIRYTELKFPDNESELHDDEDGSNASLLGKQFREDFKAATVPLLREAEDINEDRTPSFAKGNKFFGIPLTDSATASPRWTTRLQRKSPLEKTEFASEYTEGSVSNEVDGDSILHHLKRQVRLDRKSLIDLYMELDEERSASAVAANNAMAMITWLQAEKAAVQMEALQYQRMMEEQAEYDQEALQATKDMLAKSEEDFKALQAELEVYREKYGGMREEDFMESGDEVDEDYHELKSQSHSSYTERSECISPTVSSTEAQNKGENEQNEERSSSLQNENEDRKKSQEIFQGTISHHQNQLNNLEKKIHFSSEDEARSSQSGSENVNHIVEDTEKESKENLMRELSHLHKWVNGLKEDGGFFKLADHTLQNDSEREKFLAEISDNLQKLRHFITMPFDVDHDARFSS